MNTYIEKLREVQEYAFNVLREYPIDKTAANVIAALANASNRERIELFEHYRNESAEKINYDLQASCTVERLLHVIGLLDYVNN